MRGFYPPLPAIILSTLPINQAQASQFPIWKWWDSRFLMSLVLDSEWIIMKNIEISITYVFWAKRPLLCTKTRLLHLPRIFNLSREQSFNNEKRIALSLFLMLYFLSSCGLTCWYWLCWCRFGAMSLDSEERLDHLSAACFPSQDLQNFDAQQWLCV